MTTIQVKPKGYDVETTRLQLLNFFIIYGHNVDVYNTRVLHDECVEIKLTDEVDHRTQCSLRAEFNVTMIS